MSETSTPKVSICLPVFNGSAYLSGAIESVLAQSFVDFELLIADDGSQDASAEIAQKYAALDKRIVFWINAKRLGLFANYNACLAKAKGTYIKLFAQDDLLESNAIARLVDVLDRSPEVTLVSGGKCWIDRSGKETKRIVQFAEDRLMLGKDVIIAHLIVLGNWVGEPSTVMFRARDIGSGFNQNYYHYGDIEYWFRLLENGQLFYISDVVCKFRRHAASSTTRNLAGLYFALDIFRFGEQYKDVLAELGESPDHFFKRAVETIALHVDHLVRNEGLHSDGVVAAGFESASPELSGGELVKSGSSRAKLIESGSLGSAMVELESSESKLIESGSSGSAMIESASSASELSVGAHCMRPLAAAKYDKPDRTISDNEIMRQGLFHFSRRVTELLEELIETKNELEHRQAECNRLWQAVNQMTNSVSWRLTAPLRNVREKMNQSPTAGKAKL